MRSLYPSNQGQDIFVTSATSNDPDMKELVFSWDMEEIIYGDIFSQTEDVTLIDGNPFPQNQDSKIFSKMSSHFE